MTRKKRRPRGAASIRRLASGQLEARISLGFDSEGRRIRRNVYAKSSDVLGAHIELQRRRFGDRARNAADAEKITVEAYLIQWLDEVRELNRVATYRLRKGICSNHIIPHLGPLKLGTVEPSHVRGLLTTLRSRGVGARTRQTVHSILSRAFHLALKDELVARNVVQLVDRPRVPEPRRYVLSEKEARQLIVTARDGDYFALYVLALTTGLRQGEIFALEWEDVDLSNAVVHVRATLTEDETGNLVRTEPKTRSSRRIVDLPEITVDALRKHQVSAGSNGFVFCDVTGRPLRKSNFIRRNFHPLLEHAKLPRVTFHSLRHVANSILLAHGANVRLLADRLGHSTTRTTLDHYSHVLTGSQRELAKKLDGVFGDLQGVMAN